MTTYDRPPLPKYQVPEIYGLTYEDKKNMRMRYLRNREQELQDRRRDYLKLKISAHPLSKWLPQIYIDEIDKQLDKITKEKFFYKTKKSHVDIDIEELKSRVRIPDLLALHGIQVVNKRFFKLRQNERTASAHFDTDKNVWYDFGSGQGGSVIDLYMLINNSSLSDAIKTLNNLI